MQVWLFIALFVVIGPVQSSHVANDNEYTSFITTADKIKMYWKKNEKIIGNFKELKKVEPGLVFAMNAGMFNPE